MHLAVIAQAGERAKTAVEVAEEERQRLEALEVRRLKRMRAGPDADEADADDGGGLGAPKGGYAARRLKRQRGAQAVADVGGPSGDCLCPCDSPQPLTCLPMQGAKIHHWHTFHEHLHIHIKKVSHITPCAGCLSM